jgi:hypothetical protein
MAKRYDRVISAAARRTGGYLITHRGYPGTQERDIRLPQPRHCTLLGRARWCWECYWFSRAHFTQASHHGLRFNPFVVLWVRFCRFRLRQLGRLGE